MTETQSMAFSQRQDPQGWPKEQRRVHTELCGLTVGLKCNFSLDMVVSNSHSQEMEAGGLLYICGLHSEIDGSLS